MSDRPQNYANHAKLVPAYHYAIFTILFVNLVVAVKRLGGALFSDAPVTFDGVMAVLMALAFIGIAFYARIFPLGAQDRIIRQEMRLRFKEVLPEDLQGRVEGLRRGQWVALRFAGDGELAELTREALDHGLSGKQIKQKIQDWQADHFRL